MYPPTMELSQAQPFTAEELAELRAYAEAHPIPVYKPVTRPLFTIEAFIIGELGESSPSNPALPVLGAMRGDTPLSWNDKEIK